MTTARIEGRSFEQAREALAHANRIRSERSRFKKQLRKLEKEQAIRMVAALIDRPHEWAETWRIGELLLALPQWGKVKVRKHCRHVGCAETKTLATLTVRQRAEFVWLLGDGPTPWEKP